MAESTRTTKVAYVMGVYRSGTTLLSNLIGQLDGFFCVGELRAIWRELGLESARCGCGAPLIECDNWRRILEAAFGSVANAQELAPRMLQWQKRALRLTHTWSGVPGLLMRRRLGPGQSSTRLYAEGISRLYGAIAEVTGAKVVVDSSKEPTDAALVRLLPELSTSLVQIVRDPRGNVYSSIRAGSGGRAQWNSHWGRSAYTALSWVAGNIAAAMVRRVHGRQRSLLIRYEDLVEKPDDALSLIANFLGECVPMPAAEGGAIVMNATHSVAGNESRFRTGLVALAQDTAWRSGLKAIDRYVVDAICAPLMILYGYQMDRSGSGQGQSDRRRPAR